LLLLREFQPVRVYSTPAVRKIVTEDNSMFGMLRQFPEQLVWNDVYPGERFEVLGHGGSPSGIRCEPIAMPASYPPYVRSERRAGLPANEAVLGLIVEASAGGKRLAYFPGMPEVSDAWLKRMESCDLLLLDGTFWSTDELPRTRGGGRNAQEMGHVPLSGSDGSLARLASLTRPRKIYTHINNTNPILDEESHEYRSVRESGWEVARDGMEFTL
jgi:pyrroloquinoline quinone biosynthesis protein B